jgi:hypothetical protein
MKRIRKLIQPKLPTKHKFPEISRECKSVSGKTMLASLKRAE